MHTNQVADFVYTLLNNLPPFLFYHNAQHTKNVVAAALYLAKKENINGEETALLQTAALLHDTGFSVHADGKKHEEASCKIANEILPKLNYSAKQTEQICVLIMATKLPQKPSGILQNIICDADLFYLGTDDFLSTGHLLFKELEASKKVATEAEWYNQQIQFLSAHKYFTHTAQQLQTKKLHNLQSIIEKQQHLL